MNIFNHINKQIKKIFFFILTLFSQAQGMSKPSALLFTKNLTLITQGSKIFNFQTIHKSWGICGIFALWYVQEALKAMNVSTNEKAFCESLRNNLQNHDSFEHFFCALTTIIRTNRSNKTFTNKSHPHWENRYDFLIKEEVEALIKTDFFNPHINKTTFIHIDDTFFYKNKNTYAHINNTFANKQISTLIFLIKEPGEEGVHWSTYFITKKFKNPRIYIFDSFKKKLNNDDLQIIKTLYCIINKDVLTLYPKL